MFPHHENERAQNIALNGEKAGPQYWMHNGLLTMEDHKMSKSLGNIVLLSEAFKKYDPVFVRFFLLSAHYRHSLNWSESSIQSAANRFDGWIIHLSDYVNAEGKIVEEVYDALLEDLNFPKAFTIFDKILKKALQEKDKTILKKLYSTLDFFGCMPTFEFINDADFDDYEENKKAEMFKKLEVRNLARSKSDFELADKIRKEIEDLGYFVVDNNEGSVLKKKYKSIL